MADTNFFSDLFDPPSNKAKLDFELPEFKVPQKEAPDVEVDTPAPSKRTRSSGLMAPDEYRPAFEQSARKYDVPVNVLMALGHQESRYNAKAIGQPTQWGRANGMMQYLNDTARQMGINPFDPYQSIDAAAKQIRQRLDKGYSMEDAVKEHFAGPDRKKWGEKTAAYGREVLAKADQIGEMYTGGKVTPLQTAASAPEQAETTQKDGEQGDKLHIDIAGVGAKEDAKQADMDQYAAKNEGFDATKLVESGFTDTIGGIGKQLGDAVWYHMPASVAQAIEGGDPYAERDWKDSLIERSRKRIAESAKPGDDKRPTAIPGITQQDINSLGPSLGFSGTGMAAGFGVGVPTSALGTVIAPGVGTAAGVAAGTAASGTVAYRMAKNSFIRDVRDAADAESIKNTGKPMTDEEFGGKMKEIDGLATEYGLWEAVPEAASNAIGFGVLKAPVKGAIGKLFGNNVLTRLTTKAGSLYGSELATETITQQGQHNVEVDAGLTKEPKRDWTSPSDIGKSFGEVAGPTALQTTIMGGGTKLGMKAYDRLTGKSQAEGAPAPDIQPAPDAQVAPAPEQPSQVAQPVQEAQTQAPQPTQTITETRPEPSDAHGPLTRATENVAKEPERVTVTAPAYGQISGFLESMTQDDQGGFEARVLGDDGQMYHFTHEDGVMIESQQGPLSNAIDGARTQDAQESVAAAPIAEAPQPEVAAPPVAEAQQPEIAEVQPEASPETQAVQEAQTEQADQTPTADQEVAPKPVEEVEGKPAAPPTRTPEEMRQDFRRRWDALLPDQTLPQLREHLKYVVDQAKRNGGWSKATVMARREIEREINKRLDAIEAEGKDTAPAGTYATLGEAYDAAQELNKSTGKEHKAVTTLSGKKLRYAVEPVEGTNVREHATSIRDDSVASGEQARADEGTNARAGEASEADAGRQGGDGRKRKPDTGQGVSDADKATDQQPALEEKKDIAAGKWFGSRDKAQAFIEKRGLGDTHEIKQTGKVRFEAKPKATEEGYQPFPAESGTLGIPRSEMPQVPTEAHGGLVRHLNAQGIEHETKQVPADELKPTQAEFSPEKIEQSKSAEGDRAIIVSNDGHIIDGHHQALAAQEEGEDVKAIVLDAPIEQALEAVKNSPSAEKKQTTEQVREPERSEAKKPTTKEKKAALAKRMQDTVGFGVGDTVVPSMNVDYLTAGRPMQVEDIDITGRVFFRNPETGGGTSVKLSLMEAMKHRGLTFEVTPKQAEAQTPATEQAGKPPIVELPKKPDPFANNKLFTKERVEAARARMKSKLGQLNSGIDPELLIDGITIAGAYIESGTRTFAAYSKAMIDDFGDAIKPYLLSFYEGVRNYPGVDSDGMTSAEDAKREHSALLTPEDKTGEHVGEVKEKPAKRSRKTGAASDMTLTQDWGVDHINGYSNDRNRETGNTTKDAFLKEADKYLKAVASELEAAGFTAFLDRKEKGKAVGKSEAGPAVSGEVSLTMRGPNGIGIFAQIGGSSLRGLAPTTQSGIAILYRTNTESDRYGARSTNRWAPVDLSARDLADMLKADVAKAEEHKARKEKAHEPEQLDFAGTGALEGVPAKEVQGTTEEREAGRGAETRGGADTSRNEPARSQRVPEPRGVGDGETTVPVPARGDTTEGRVRKSDAGRDHERGGRDQVGHGEEVRDRLTPASGTPSDERPTGYTILAPDEIGAGGQKTKFKNNIAAIQLLKQLEQEGRQATRSEQEALSKYVGWGGLPQAFVRSDGSVSKGWEREAKELQDVLTKEEYDAAAASTRNAHYTSPQIVQAMWTALNRLGFDGGKLLEPSVGVGTFFGLMPTQLHGRTALHGVELDHITGGIAKHIYPQAKIATPMGFQNYTIPNGYFDAVIGNPPFGSEKLYDPKRKDLSKFSIHNYFFAKSLDGLKPNGVLAMVVTNRMMDGTADAARQYLSKRAELLGAIRLPNDAFMANAGTEVTTDIIFMRRLAHGETRTGETWGEVVDYTDAKGIKVPLNEYFVRHPEMMLGEFGAYGSMYSPTDPALVAREGQDTQALLAKAIEALPQNVISTPRAAPAIEIVQKADSATTAKVGSMFMEGDTVMLREPDSLGEVQSKAVEFPSEKAKERVKGMIAIRDVAADLRRLQLSRETSDKQLTEARKRLNEVYDAFVKDNGPINLDANKRLFREDPTWPQISALEDKFDKGISATVARNTGQQATKPSAMKAPIFTKRTQSPYTPPTSAKTAKDALTSSLAELGHVDIAMMERLYGKPEDTIIKELGDLVYNDPEKGWVTRDEYLSGNVKAKLAAAKAAGNTRNIEALEAVQPKDIDAVDIAVKVGAHWLPVPVMTDFVKEISEGTKARIIYNPATAEWSVSEITASAAANQRLATDRVSLKQVIEAAANQKSLQVYDTNHADNTRTLNETATQLANDKVNLVKEEWGRWVWQDDTRRAALTRLYNDTFNTDVNREYDGEHLSFPGKVGDDVIKLRPHQANAIWRITQSNTTLLDHVVGAGKTFTMIGAAMEMRRMGLARKPMFVVPNHLVGQWAGDFNRLYPGANVLATTKRDFEKENRKRLFARIANGDWDAVIVAHSSFGMVQVDPQSESDYIERQIADLLISQQMLEEAEGGKSRNVKKVQDRITRLREAQKKALDTGRKDDNLYFNELGADALFVDEAHEFKNLGFSSTMNRVAGLGNQTGSNKAKDMHLKIDQVLQATGGRNIVFATGTPISNTMAEMYTLMRYLDYPALHAQGAAHFDAWARMYGEVVTDWELSPSGQYKLNSRFAKFVNIPELMQRYSSFSDVINNGDIKRMLEERGQTLPVPKVRGGKPQNVVVERSPQQALYIGEPIKDADGNDTSDYPRGSLVWRAENLPKKAVKGADNMLKIMSDARKAALDMRLIDPSAPDYAGSKVNVAADNIKQIYDQWTKDKGTQLVFIDLSTPNASKGKEAQRIRDLVAAAEQGDEAAQEKLDAMSPDEFDALTSKFSVYDDLKAKLIAKGIPEAEIAFIHDANTDQQKEDLFGKVRSGRVRVLFGSTAKMGAGTNVQERLVALHHLDAPWRPSDLEQREGRIIRQGNKLYEADPDNFQVDIMRYASKQTLDSRMWQTIESKANFIEQVKKGASGQRTVEDIAGEAANAAEMKAASSGNPLILEEMSLRQQIRRLETERTGHDREQYRLRDTIREKERSIDYWGKKLDQLKADTKLPQPSEFAITINGRLYDKRADAGEAILNAVTRLKGDSATIGKYGDFEVELERVGTTDNYMVSLNGKGQYETTAFTLGADPTGLAVRVSNTVKDLDYQIERTDESIAKAKKDIPALEKQVVKWSKADELQEAKGRHEEVLALLRPKKKQQAAQEAPTPQEEDGPRYSIAMPDDVADTITVDGVERPTTNSNGQAIATTEDGIRNFWKWFGDSKVVDEGGRPQVVYHGTVSDIETFELDRVGRLDFGRYGEGFYFTSDPSNASSYAENAGDEAANVLPVYLKVTKAYRGAESVSGDSKQQSRRVTEKLKARKFDGRIIHLRDDWSWYVVFSSEQIKSAVGNTGTFDPSNPDIRYSVNSDGNAIGEFGPIHTEYKNDAAAAIDRIMADKTGEAIISHPTLGEISLIYGDERKGLAHIVKRRGEDFLKQIPAILQSTNVYEKERQTKRVFLGTDTHEATIRMDWDGEAKTWLTSAYEKYTDLTKKDSPEKGNRSIVVYGRTADRMSPATMYQQLTEGIAKRAIQKLIDNGDIVLHRSESSLPYAWSRRFKGVEGMTTKDGKIHLVGSTTTPQTLFGVLLHEGLHSKVRPLLGDKTWGDLMGRLGTLYRDAERSTGRAREFFDKARNRVAYARREEDLSGKREVEEFAAYAISEYETAPATVRKWVDDLLGHIKAWLLNNFGKQFGDITPAQLRALAIMAIKEHAATINPTRGPPDVVWQSGRAREKGMQAFGEGRVISAVNHSIAEPETKPIPKAAEQAALDAYNRAAPDRKQLIKQLPDYYSYRELTEDDLLDTFGDRDEIPQDVLDILDEHGSVAAIERSPDDFEYVAPGNEEQFWDDALKEEFGWTGASEVDSLDDIFSGRVRTFDAADALKAFAKSVGWAAVKTDSSGDSHYYTLYKQDDKGNRFETPDGDYVSLGVRVSNHARQSRQGHAVRGKAEVDINLAPSDPVHDSHSFQDLYDAMQTAEGKRDALYSIAPEAKNVTPEQADAVVDDAMKALEYDGPLAKDDYIGRAVQDISLGARMLVHSRTVASIHPEFTPVYRTAVSQMETRDGHIADLGRDVVTYDRLPQESKANVNKVLELGRLTGQVYPSERLADGIANPGTKSGVEFVDGKSVRRKVPINAALTAGGEVVKLNEAEIKAYTDLRNMFDRALDMIRDQTLREFDLGHLASEKNAAKAIMDMAKAKPENAERLQNIAQFVAEIEQAKKAGYVPFNRYGDYVVTVKEKIADFKFVEDDTGHHIVMGVPDEMSSDMLALGAEKNAEGWRIKKSQRLDVEKLSEKTVYSTKVDTNVGDLISEHKAEKKGGRIDEIKSVGAAIATAKKEWVEGHPNRRVVAFKVRQKTADGQVKLSDIDSLAEVSALDNATWDTVRDALADAIKARGFRRHFINSDNVPGYSVDFERSVADYVIGMSGYLSRRQHAKAWDNTVSAIKNKPKLHQYASRYRDYVNNPQEEFALVRQIGFFSYISGVAASAAVNLTQVPIMTLPTLSQVAPMRLVAKELTKAYKDAFKMMGRPTRIGLDMFDPKKAPADVRDAVMSAWDKGAFVPLDTFDLMMTARQRNIGTRKGTRVFNKATELLSAAFTFAERMNRLVTFIASARLADKRAVRMNAERVLRNNALAKAEILGKNWNAENFAQWVVEESQYRMGKTNRPTAMRGAGTAILQFKSFMLQTFEAWYRMAVLHGKEGKFAAISSVAILFAIAGLWGMPGADDLRKLIENIYKAMSGKDLDLKTELRQWVARTSGSVAVSQIVNKGVAYPLGVDMTRVGLGSVVPDSPLALAGIPFDMAVGRPKRAFEKWSAGDEYGAVSELTPNFLKHPIQALGWANDGVRDKYGNRILTPNDISYSDITMKILGFAPSKLTDIRDYEYAQRRQETAVDALKRSYTDRIARATAELEKTGNPAKQRELEGRISKLYDEIDAHNDSSGEERQIKIDKRALSRRIARELEGVKSTWGKERKNARGAADDLRELFDVKKFEGGDEQRQNQ